MAAFEEKSLAQIVITRKPDNRGTCQPSSLEDLRGGEIARIAAWDWENKLNKDDSPGFSISKLKKDLPSCHAKK